MRAAARMLVCAALLACLAGCDQANEGGVPAVDIVLSPSGLITLNGTPVNVQNLPAKLKQAGAGRQTSVRVRVPDGTSRQTLQRLGAHLASGGYSRIVFSKPQKAHARVKRR